MTARRRVARCSKSEENENDKAIDIAYIWPKVIVNQKDKKALKLKRL
jgi:hypothetical protein